MTVRATSISASASPLALRASASRSSAAEGGFFGWNFIGSFLVELLVYADTPAGGPPSRAVENHDLAHCQCGKIRARVRRFNVSRHSDS